MAKTVADFVLSRLGEWGVRRVFGYPGDGINGLITVLRSAVEKIGPLPHSSAVRWR